MSVGRSRVGAVVVHHRSPVTLAATMKSLTGAGIRPEDLVVVDNSGEACAEAELLAILPDGSTLLRTSNRGYAAAVNCGVRELHDVDCILVATHETLIGESSLLVLEQALRADPRLAAVGPVLRTPDGGLWSAGGRLTYLLRIPRHVLDLGSRESRVVQPVSWLDGALVLYRATALTQHPLDERFFLYMEEVDYHQQLARRGWKVAICHGATATQDSKGMPAFYAVRNITLFQSKWGRPGFRSLAVAYVALRTALLALRDRDGADMVAIAKGFWAGRRRAW